MRNGCFPIRSLNSSSLRKQGSGAARTAPAALTPACVGMGGSGGRKGADRGEAGAGRAPEPARARRVHAAERQHRQRRRFAQGGEAHGPEMRRARMAPRREDRREERDVGPRLRGPQERRRRMSRRRNDPFGRRDLSRLHQPFRPMDAVRADRPREPGVGGDEERRAAPPADRGEPFGPPRPVRRIVVAEDHHRVGRQDRRHRLRVDPSTVGHEDQRPRPAPRRAGRVEAPGGVC